MKVFLNLSKPWAGMVPIESVIRNPDQPRKTFPQAEIEALAESMKEEDQVTPCAVMPALNGAQADLSRSCVQVNQWMLVDGEMRWRAAQHAKKAELYVCYKPGVTSANLHVVSFAANFCRTPHTKHETALAVDKERKAGRTYEAIGKIVGKTAAWAQQHHVMLQLHPDLLRYIDEPDPFTGRKLAMKVALLFVGQDHERQLTVYKRHRCKSSNEQYHAARTTAVVKSGRGPADDLRYLMGTLNNALGRVKTVTNAGEVMLRRFSASQLEDLITRAGQIGEAVKALTARLKEHEGRAG